MLKALGTKLIIERVERQEKTSGGIIISNQQDKTPLAKVISIGDQVKIKVSVGDSVVVSWANTAQQPSQGTNYYIIDETGVYATEEE
jgi:chaperonin GroES